jgi:hypothetical protein
MSCVWLKHGDEDDNEEEEIKEAGMVSGDWNKEKTA